MSLLTYVKPEPMRLKDHPQLNERWLQDRIAEDPTILGLGEVMLIGRERRQESGGRLDLLLSDPEQGIRYEVELQLGATDESHIVRTIEYWDVERRRYPGMDHVAVLVAEDITSRFLNVLQLFSGTIPFVAIQLSALRLETQIALNFVKVIDQRLLRVDDEAEDRSPPADRAYWLDRIGPQLLSVVEGLIEMLRKHSGQPLNANYTRKYIGLTDGQRVQNFVLFYPRKQYVRVGFRVDAKSWIEPLEEAGLAATVTRRGRLRLNLRAADLEKHASLLDRVLQQTVATQD